MNDLQIKEFELKLRAAIKPDYEVRFWQEDYGTWLCYVIQSESKELPLPGHIEVSSLTTTYDIEVNVQEITNYLSNDYA